MNVIRTVEALDRVYTNFARRMSIPTATAEGTIARVVKEYQSLEGGDQAELFVWTMYDTLWAEDENLAQRRLAGELDDLWPQLRG